LVIVGVLSKRRGRALRTPTTPRPASASASAMTPTVRLSLNYYSRVVGASCSRRDVHVKSLRAHALRSLISARKKLVGQRVTLENQIRGLAVVFGIRLPRALTTAFIDRALKVSEGAAGLSAAMRGRSAARAAVMIAVAAIDADIRRRPGPPRLAAG
jgi:transposase